jgi:hypothetical protein
MEVNMKKVIMIQQPETNELTGVIIGDRYDNIMVTLSKPNMVGKFSWLTYVHDLIIDSEFQVTQSIVKDLSNIVKKHHAIYSTNINKFSIDNYINDFIPEIIEELCLTFDASNDVNDLIGEIDGISSKTYVMNLVKNQLGKSSSETFNEVLDRNNIDEIIMRVELTDKHGNEILPYVIYNLTSNKLNCYINADDFFENIEYKRYGYCGYVKVPKCLNDDMLITDDILSLIKKRIHKEIDEFNNKDMLLSKIDKALEL